MRYAIAVLGTAGIALSCLALAGRYAETVRPLDVLRVNWNSAYVNQSPYAEVHGVPLSVLGIAVYAVLIVLAMLRRRVLTAYWAAIVLVYGLYLTNIESRVLYVWCAYWVSSFILSVLIAFLAVGWLIW
jgi:uncharacterized membrane protein